MSHFAVLVIGEDPEGQLAPYSEQDEEFASFIDCQAELERKYKEDEVEMIETPSGELCYAWDDRFKHGEFLNRETIIPEDHIKKTIKMSDKYKTIEEYAKDWHGYQQDPETGHWGYYANAESKWDWYSLGGRFNGFFKLKDHKNNGRRIDDTMVQALAIKYKVDPEYIRKLANITINSKDPGHMKFELRKEYGYDKLGIMGGYELEKTIEELCKVQYEDAVAGDAGVFGGIPKEGWVDQARWKDIDFEGMRKEAEKHARRQYRKIASAFGGEIPVVKYKWKDFLDETSESFKNLDIDEKRKWYKEQPEIVKLHELQQQARDGAFDEETNELLIWLDMSFEDYMISEDEFVEKRGKNRGITFAVVKDGEWYERGEMGWWACVSNEKEEDEWTEEFNKLIEGLDSNTLLSLYDCHI